MLNLRWNGPKYATYYDIWRAGPFDTKEDPSPDNAKYKLIATITESRHVDAEVRKTKEFFGKTYYYKIASKDKFSKLSPMSEPHEVKIVRPKQVNQKRVNYTLKIQRTKEVLFVKPQGGGTALQSCYDAAFLSDGESLVYVDTLSSRVAVTNETGEQIRTIGEAGIRPDQYKEPIRLAIDKNDDIYLLDNKKPTIFVYEKSGKFKAAFKVHTISEKEVLDHYEQLTEPLMPKLNAILIHGDKIYTADKMTGVIQIYNKADGVFIDYYRNKETDEIIYAGLVSKMLLRDGKLYLAKPFERKIERLDFKTSETLYNVGMSRGSIGGFWTINGMAFTEEGNLIVSDGVTHTVQAFGEDGIRSNYLFHLGDEKAFTRPLLYKPIVNLDFPGTVSVDSRGRIWIYLSRDKGFTIREYVGDKLWDADVDQPEALQREK
ncbi:6-bladed beta-propeller [Thermodesulfobacteriota bacterium]